MGTGDHQGSPRLNEEQAQSLRERNIGDALAQHGVGFGIIPRYRIADDDKIGPRLQVRCPVARQNRNPDPLQVGAHRRINVLIGAGDAIPPGLKQAGKEAMPTPQIAIK